METYGIAYEAVRAGTPPRKVGVTEGGNGGSSGEPQTHPYAGRRPRFLARQVPAAVAITADTAAATAAATIAVNAAAAPSVHCTFGSR